MGRQGPGTLTGSIVPASGPPCTLAIWIRYFSFQTSTIFELEDGSGRSLYLSTMNDGRAAAIAYDDRSQTVYGTAYSETTYRLGNWSFVAGVFEETASRSVFLNGVMSSPETSEIGFDSTIACRLTASAHSIIAFPAVWSAALTRVELTALWRGENPDKIRPNARGEFWCLGGSGSVLGSWRGFRLSPSTNPPIWAPDPLILSRADVAPALRLATGAPPETASSRPRRWYPGLSRRRR